MIYLTKLITGGRIAPDDEEHREYWTIRPRGHAPWFVRLAQDPKGAFRSESVADSMIKSETGSVMDVNHTIEEKM
jgi:hypothetical protein